MNIFKAILPNHNVSFSIYIDGLGHPVKAAENAQRDSARVVSTSEFKAIALANFSGQFFNFESKSMWKFSNKADASVLAW